MKGGASSGGGCCIARYAHHHDPISAQTYYNNPNNNYDSSKFDHIMLRFRPIAPKPVVGGPATTTTTADTHKNDAVRKGRRRGMVVSTAGGAGISKRRRKSRSPNHQKSDDYSISSKASKVTLPLLPETPDLSPKKSNHDLVGQSKSSVPLTWLCFGSSLSDHNQTVVESSVTVEKVTDTWMDGNDLGCTDEERRRRLDEDTCPGFISDRWNRVWWTNKAYRRMVTGGEDRVGVQVEVGMREKVELATVKVFPAFTCRVKVEYYSKEGKHQRMTLPCDAWRLDGGGFAWRLDIKAALSLSLGLGR